MALIVEDGSGKADAESYASLAQADTIAAAHGLASTWSALAESAKEAALRASTMWLDGTYGPRFTGLRQFEGQALEWPRGFASLAGGGVIASGSIPVQLIRACVLAAIEHSKSGGAFIAGDNIASESVGLGSGALSKSVTYHGSKSSGFRPQAAILSLQSLLTPYSLERS